MKMEYMGALYSLSIAVLLANAAVDKPSSVNGRVNLVYQILNVRPLQYTSYCTYPSTHLSFESPGFPHTGGVSSAAGPGSQFVAASLQTTGQIKHIKYKCINSGVAASQNQYHLTRKKCVVGTDTNKTIIWFCKYM